MMPRKLKPPIFKLFLIILSVSLTLGWTWPLSSKTQNKEPKKSSSQIQKENTQLQNDYDQLKQKFEALNADRNNVLEQTRILLTERSKSLELKESYEKLLKTQKVLSKETSYLHQLAKKSRADQTIAKENLDYLNESYATLKEKHDALMEQVRQLQEALKAKVESTPLYQNLDAEAKKIKSENARLAQENKALDANLKKKIEHLKKMENRNAGLAKDNKVQKKEIKKLTSEKKDLIKRNQSLDQEIKIAPKRFKDMANENKTMLKETAQMHYNMGVLFIRNRQPDRAISEFHRALDFNPNNPQVHYNLGYLLSEEYEQHEEAMVHFKRFLEIDPSSKEAHQVRSYLMIREAYGDKIPKN